MVVHGLCFTGIALRPDPAKRQAREAGVGRSGPCRGSATGGPASVDGQNMARHHSGFFRAEPHDSVRLFLSADRATNGLVLDEIVDHPLTYFSTDRKSTRLNSSH